MSSKNNASVKNLLPNQDLEELAGINDKSADQIIKMNYMPGEDEQKSKLPKKHGKKISQFK